MKRDIDICNKICGALLWDVFLALPLTAMTFFLASIFNDGFPLLWEMFPLFVIFDIAFWVAPWIND